MSNDGFVSNEISIGYKVLSSRVFLGNLDNKWL